MQHFEYPVLLKRAKEGYVVTSRDLPALVTQGNDKRDALAQAADIISLDHAT